MHRRLWATVDRWGPGAVAVLTLFAVIALGWQYSEKLAASRATAAGLQKQIDSLQSQISDRNVLESALRLEIQTWQAHVIALRLDMIKAGVKDITPLPQPVRYPSKSATSTSTPSSDPQQRKKR